LLALWLCVLVEQFCSWSQEYSHLINGRRQSGIPGCADRRSAPASVQLSVFRCPARSDRGAVLLGFFRCPDLNCRIMVLYGQQASVDLNHSTFAKGRRRARDGRSVADTVTAPSGLWGRSTGFPGLRSSAVDYPDETLRWATIGRGGAWKIRARTLGARSSSSSMLISTLQTSFRNSATSAVNCVIVRETGFDGSNWDMGFIDCLSLARPLSA